MPDAHNYRYRRLLDLDVAPVSAGPAADEEVADRAPAARYAFDDKILFSVNLALATSRPLLVRGPPGAGKSSIAAAVAARAAWSFYSVAITSRTQAQDLLYEIDYVRRFQDAQVRELAPDIGPYLIPGPLFWAFDPAEVILLKERIGYTLQTPPGYREGAARAVVLLDEIDKADPDLPNNLLVTLGQLSFAIPELGLEVKADTKSAPLMVLTTNGERELPAAFLRRCIELVLDAQGEDRLIEIAKAHELDGGSMSLPQLARLYVEAPRAEDRPPNAAEFLDFVRAWRVLELENDQITINTVLNAITHCQGAGD